MGVSKKIINVYFRISLINKNGLGHFLRCLRLSQTFPENYKKIFLVDSFNKEIIKLLNLKNYEIISVYNNKSKFKNNLYDAEKVLKIIKNRKDNLFFIDDYRINYLWHKKIYKYCKKLIVIDDLLDRKFYCDFYINFKEDLDGELFKSAKIKNLKKNKILIGSKYCILDKNIKYKIENRNKKNILISFGNSFDFKAYETFFKKIQKINCKVLICIGVFSKNYEYLLKIERKNKNFKVIFKEIFIEKYLSTTDLFIGSAGNSIYEMSYLNIPSIFTQLTNNQKNNLKFLENLGHFFFLDKKEFFTEECIHLIFKILSQYNRIKKMNKYKKIYLDKKGAKRIKKAIF